CACRHRHVAAGACPPPSHRHHDGRVMTQTDDMLLVHAYLDGELDPAHALEVERRFAAEPALAAERDRVSALRRLLRDRLPRERAPAALTRRVELATGLRREQTSWRMLAAAALVGAVLASGATWLVLRGGGSDATPNMVLASHVRALMAPQP